ncbi:MAG: putative sulfate exporter family transporter [Candidatus Omnitrophica bacterium]|nr:putative sulfate exporter family transporter [Candidatus Omnitrophota bacterium]MDE2008688.1 putative sulfate exporter family transporter [Candidatus Omnitrophota bacterium]MDE2214829.1 putative sulfate exporter family transporter [Candidatus Omnitrophota bacterium]MDE2231949.1 putative sulfate exporter family transporter [Candidatus Omnitrophota bacterium]
MVAQIIFLIGLVFCFTPFASPPSALAVGLLIAFTIQHPFKVFAHRAIKYLLEISVVGLGFGLNFAQVIKAGEKGVVFTVVSIAATLLIGWLIGKSLGINKKISYLISAGTAICGGSAIAATAPIINAHEDEVAVALGTIFILNSIALFLFPPLGHHLGLTMKQFGMWSAIAIHDTSSVVGASARYGDEALKIATIVKLTRALWIVPLSLGTIFVLKNRPKRKTSAKIAFPYFILGFVGASLVVTFFPGLKSVYAGLVDGSKVGLTVTLFLIGAGLSRDKLKTVGVKPVVQGIILWALISVVSLMVVKNLC